MAVEFMNSYSSYVTQNTISNSKINDKKKKDAEQTAEKYGSGKAKSTADSKDGIIYLYDTDMKTIIEAAKEDNVENTKTKKPTHAGANLDLKI